MVNSLKRKITALMRITAITANAMRSCPTREAAFPNKNWSRPVCAAFPDFWIIVSIKMPMPKNTDSIRPMAVSSLIFDLAEM